MIEICKLRADRGQERISAVNLLHARQVEQINQAVSFVSLFVIIFLCIFGEKDFSWCFINIVTKITDINLNTLLKA